jgi:hypothetical protein
MTNSHNSLHPMSTIETELHSVTIQLRGADGDDPGVVETGYFVCVDGKVSLCTPEGKLIGSWVKTEGVDPKRVAARLLRAPDTGSRWSNSFNRRLNYPKLGIV